MIPFICNLSVALYLAFSHDLRKLFSGIGSQIIRGCLDLGAGGQIFSGHGNGHFADHGAGSSVLFLVDLGSVELVLLGAGLCLDLEDVSGTLAHEEGVAVDVEADCDVIVAFLAFIGCPLYVEVESSLSVRLESACIVPCQILNVGVRAGFSFGGFGGLGFSRRESFLGFRFVGNAVIVEDVLGLVSIQAGAVAYGFIIVFVVNNLIFILCRF